MDIETRMMNLYEEKVLPHLINCACGSKQVMKLRSEIVPQCRGQVLEIGMGSGLNLEFYQAKHVEFVWGLEPSTGMRQKAQSKLRKSPVEVKWLDLPGEAIPLEDNSVDTVLLTFTLCTIPDPQTALAQMRRVLKPGGKLLFCEHGLSDSRKIKKWQHRVNPVWTKLAGGCNLNREIDQLIADAGFNIDTLREFYAPKTPKVAGFIYMGSAG